MITSFLSDTKHDGDDLLRCLSNLPKLSPAIFPHDGKFGTQYDSCLDEVFVLLESIEENDRIQAYSILGSFLSVENGLSLRLVASSRINTMLDRLPSSFEKMDSVDEINGFMGFFESLLQLQGLDSHMNKHLPKLITRLCKYLKNQNGSIYTYSKLHFCISCIVVILESAYSNLILQSCTLLKCVCLDLMGQDSYPYDSVAKCFALLISIDTSTSWNLTWKFLSEKVITLLVDHLGFEIEYEPVFSTAEMDYTTKLNSSSNFNNNNSENVSSEETEMRKAQQCIGGLDNTIKGVFGNISKSTLANDYLLEEHTGSQKNDHAYSSGCRRALYVERLFSSHLMILGNMLRIGCATGAIKIDMHSCSIIFSSVLTIYLHRSSDDPKVLLHNKCGVSQADVSLVATDMKLNTLILIQTLTSIAGVPYLNRFVKDICEPVVSLLLSKEFKNNSLIAKECIQCFGLLLATFPTVICLKLLGGVEALMTLLEKEIKGITSPPSLIEDPAITLAKTNKTTAAKLMSVQTQSPLAPLLFHASKEASSGAHPNSFTSAGTLTVLEAVEKLLLHCSFYLPESIQDSLEYLTGQALHCLSKGIQINTKPSKSVNRAQVSILRKSEKLQVQVLRMARAECVYVHVNGHRSGNFALLLKVSQHFSTIKYNLQLNYEAQQCKLLTEALMNPSVGPMVSPNYDDIEQKRKLYLETRMINAQNVIDKEIEQRKEREEVEQRKEQEEGKAFVDSDHDDAMDTTKQELKKKVVTSKVRKADTASNNTITKRVRVQASSNAAKSTSSPSSMNTMNNSKNAKKDKIDDDDFELPEINMD